MKAFMGAILGLLLLASAAAADQCTVSATDPANGQTVGSDLTAIRVTFSAPVKPGSYSFVSDPSKGEFPEMTGKPMQEGPQTFILPVRLKPNTRYAVGINWGRFNGFRLAADQAVACKPFMLVFTTAD